MTAMAAMKKGKKAAAPAAPNAMKTRTQDFVCLFCGRPGPPSKTNSTTHPYILLCGWCGVLLLCGWSRGGITRHCILSCRWCGLLLFCLAGRARTYYVGCRWCGTVWVVVVLFTRQAKQKKRTSETGQAVALASGNLTGVIAHTVSATRFNLFFVFELSFEICA